MHQWSLLRISHLRDYKLLFTQLWLTLGSKPTKQRRQINKDLLGIKLSDKNFFCVTLIDFLPLIKRVSQFLIKGEFFLERERERETYFNFIISLLALP